MHKKCNFTNDFSNEIPIFLVTVRVGVSNDEVVINETHDSELQEVNKIEFMESIFIKYYRFIRRAAIVISSSFFTFTAKSGKTVANVNIFFYCGLCSPWLCGISRLHENYFDPTFFLSALPPSQSKCSFENIFSKKIIFSLLRELLWVPSKKIIDVFLIEFIFFITLAREWCCPC